MGLFGHCLRDLPLEGVKCRLDLMTFSRQRALPLEGEEADQEFQEEVAAEGLIEPWLHSLSRLLSAPVRARKPLKSTYGSCCLKENTINIVDLPAAPRMREIQDEPTNPKALYK